MTWQGNRNWPPHWSGPHGPNNPLPQGEVGVLKAVEKSAVSPPGPCCVLTVAHGDQDYFGSLSFDDEDFSKHIFDILTSHIGEPISAVGSLDIG
jgi:hypothetical protein